MWYLGLSTNELLVSKGSAINRFKTADKQKSKKPKGGSITYNAVSVAPLKISIKKTCTSEVKKTSSSGETLDDNSTIHNIQTVSHIFAFFVTVMWFAYCKYGVCKNSKILLPVGHQIIHVISCSWFDTIAINLCIFKSCSDVYIFNYF